MRQNLDFKRGNEEVLLATLTAYSSVWRRIGVRFLKECRARSLSKKLARERSGVFWLSKFNTTKDSAFPQSCRARGITIFSSQNVTVPKILPSNTAFQIFRYIIILIARKIIVQSYVLRLGNKNDRVVDAVTKIRSYFRRRDKNTNVCATPSQTQLS